MRPQITCGTHALAPGPFQAIYDREMSFCPRCPESPTIPWRRSSASGRFHGLLEGIRRQLPPGGSYNPTAPLISRRSAKAINDRTPASWRSSVPRAMQTRPDPFRGARSARLIAFVKGIPAGSSSCMVDNCYGEFVEPIEPSGRGSGYDRRFSDQKSRRRPGSHRRLHRAEQRIALNNAAYRLTAPGLGQGGRRNAWASCQSFYQGLFPGSHGGSRGAERAPSLRRISMRRLGFRGGSQRQREPSRHHPGRYLRNARGRDRRSARASRRQHRWTAM